MERLSAQSNSVPDYLIRLINGKMLVLELSATDDAHNRVKCAATALWIKKVNEQGCFGQWCFDVVLEPAGMRDTIFSVPVK